MNKKKYTIHINNSIEVEDKINRFFKQYNFDSKKNLDKTVYYKKGGFFDGWKLNPFNWESEIELSFSQDKINVVYNAHGNSHITPLAFTKYYDAFFKNLENFLMNGVSYNLPNTITFKRAKQFNLLLLLVPILSIITCYIISSVIELFTVNKIFRIIVIAIIAYLPLKVINFYFKNKNEDSWFITN